LDDVENVRDELIGVLKLDYFALGNMFIDGKGVEQDHVRAVEWYTKAVNQKNAGVKAAKDMKMQGTLLALCAIRAYLDFSDIGALLQLNATFRGIMPSIVRILDCKSMQIDDHMIMPIVDKFPCVTTVTLEKCNRITNLAIPALIRLKGLRMLNLSGTQVADVSALAGCSSLHTLNISYTQVTDVSALAGCSSLHTLNLRGTKVADVSALAGCSSLHTLTLYGTKVADVSALAGCSSLHTPHLTHFHADNSQHG